MVSKREIPYIEQRLNSKAIRHLLDGSFNDLNLLRENYPDWRPTFEGCNFAGIELEDISLAGCLFRDVIFSEASCKSVDFEGSTFENCRFEQTTLVHTSFQSARLIRCVFNVAEFNETNFEGAYLSQTTVIPKENRATSENEESGGINCPRARFIGCRLHEAFFRSTTNLQYASFEDYKREEGEATHCCSIYLSSDDRNLVLIVLDPMRSDAKRLLDINQIFLGRAMHYAEEATLRNLVKERLGATSWDTLIYLEVLRRREELLPGSNKATPKKFVPSVSPPSSTLVEMRDGAIRAASEELTIACRDLAVQGVTSLPLSNELRDKLISFLKTKPGEHLIAGLLSLVLQSGITDHLPLIPDQVKTLLRERLPRELRVGAMQQIFKELGKLLLGAAGSTIAKLQEASTASPSSTPEPARLPEPSAKPFRAVPGSRIKKAPARARRGG